MNDVNPSGHARALQSLAGMLTSPVSTLRAIARDGAPVWPPLLLYVVVVLLILAKVLTRLTLLLGDGGTVIGKRIREALEEAFRTDVFLLFITCVALAGVAFVFRHRWQGSPLRAAIAGVYLIVPLTVLKAIGGALDGFDVALWWMPHFPVDSHVVVVGGRVDMMRFVVKIVVAYAVPLALAITLILGMMKPRDGGGRAPALRVGLAVLGVSTIALVAGSVSDVVRNYDRIRPTVPGMAMPEFSLRRIDELGVDDKRIKLKHFRGKVVLLDFWASWCTPCRRSFPELSALYTELKDKGFVVVGVNREPNDVAAAKEALKKLAPTFDNVVDERFYGDKLGITTLPTSYIVDKKGVLRHLHIGYTEPQVIRAEVEALLAE